jgi:tRNA-dihydrouridine synthase 1
LHPESHNFNKRGPDIVAETCYNSMSERFEFFHVKLGSPKKIVAPMVDQSDLAFRMLTRRYGADLCFTQMFNANSMVNSANYFEENFQTAPGDRPLIA